MKERWKEMLEYEQKVQALMAAPNPVTASLLDRARDFVWRCLGGHVDEAVIEATAHKVVRAFRKVMHD